MVIWTMSVVTRREKRRHPFWRALVATALVVYVIGDLFAIQQRLQQRSQFGFAQVAIREFGDAEIDFASNLLSCS